MYIITNLHAYFHTFTLQQIDSDEMLKCIIELVKLEKDWVPDSDKCPNSSLYIRPTMIATNVCSCSMHACIDIPISHYFFRQVWGYTRLQRHFSMLSCARLVLIFQLDLILCHCIVTQHLCDHGLEALVLLN